MDTDDGIIWVLLHCFLPSSVNQIAVYYEEELCVISDDESLM